jgi:hypothetical protein
MLNVIDDAGITTDGSCDPTPKIVMKKELYMVAEDSDAELRFTCANPANPRPTPEKRLPCRKDQRRPRSAILMIPLGLRPVVKIMHDYGIRSAAS